MNLIPSTASETLETAFERKLLAHLRKLDLDDQVRIFQAVIAMRDGRLTVEQAQAAARHGGIATRALIDGLLLRAAA